MAIATEVAVATVTIGIPTRNRVEYLREAVRSALAAAGPDDQIVVSDNASTDATPAFLAGLTDPRVTVLRQRTDLGMVGNWNACLAAARGDHFLMLSDDDLLEPDAIRALSPPLLDRRVAFAYGRARVVDASGALRTLGHPGVVREDSRAFVRAWFRSRRTVYPCGLMMRRADLEEAGGFDAAFGPFADVGAWLGILSATPARDVVFVPDVVASYRVHDAALSTADLRPGIAGATELARRFAAAYLPDGPAGFARIRAHFVASALRRRARGCYLPTLAYLGLLVRHAPLVLRYRPLEPYARQVVILAAPRAYERRKRAQAAGGAT